MTAADRLGFDKVIIIPSCIPPHKIAGSLASGEDRLEMCRLAFGNDSRFEISSIELERGDKSYTVETLRELKKIYPDDEIYFIIGSDMLETFTQWYRWEEILSLCVLCAASRKNGFVPDLDGYTAEQRERIVFLDIEPFEVSSTQVRIEIGRNDRSELIDEAVMDYIKNKNLYDDGLNGYRKILFEKLDEKRIYHCECVSESAAALAAKYGADTEKARLAGLLHDVTKNVSDGEHLELMRRAGYELNRVDETNRKVWHQKSGAAYLRVNGICEDEEILSAVAWHTTGRAGMSLLEKIVYVADFISADRNYNDVNEVRRRAEESLDKAILYTTRYTINKLVALGQPVHPATVDCYNDTLYILGKESNI